MIFKIIHIILISSVQLLILNAQNVGEKIFNEKCTACHTIGDGKRVGPDLANVQSRRKEDWLIKFIQSSQNLIKSGDKDAQAVFAENNNIQMPDQPLSENEVKEVLNYISLNSPDPANPNKKTPSQIFNVASLTQSDIDRGRKLFEGETKFQNGGAPCITCHNVQLPGVFTGGMLAKDLSVAFTRLGPAGIDGIIRNPPFPAMIYSFGNKPLTDQEVKDLLAFLYHSDNWNLTQNYTGGGEIYFLIISLFGINMIFLLLLVKYKRVKKNSVNSFR